MARNKTSRVQHDSPKKNRLIGMVVAGMPVLKASTAVGIPSPSAYRIVNKYRATGSTSNLPRSGRPTAVSDRTRRAVVRTAKNERRKPFQEIANTMADPISTSTVRNVLADEGYHRRVARKVPYLKPVQ
jgi:transposase